MISPSSNLIATSGIVEMLNKMSGRIFSYQADHSIHQSIHHNYKHTKQYPNPRKTIGPGPTRQLTPIKVEIVGFASVNPTWRRRSGGKETAAGQAFMNGAG